MMRIALLPSVAVALPLFFNETTLCENGECEKPDMKYETSVHSQPGYQWGDSGGYCGSWAIGRAVLAKGAWISQQSVRDHTHMAAGGLPEHDSEILTPNIDEAYRRLKIKTEHFDYKNMPTPQQPAYFKWLKKQLVAGHPVTWFIMWDGQTYPLYHLPVPDSLYGHIEPVIGFQSNHPLTDEEVYDDDVVMHFTDGGETTIHKPIKTLAGDWAGVGKKAACQSGSRYCIGPYSYGWAVQGFEDVRADALQVSLKIEPGLREPDQVKGEKPIDITGTVTVEGLTVGSTYEIYRFNTPEEAFDYKESKRITTFKATSDTFVFEDPKTFSSYSTTYYRCLPAATSTMV